MKIYVAGPMRGHEDFNIPLFESATKALRDHGHVVFNPAERDCEREGIPRDASLADKIEGAIRTNIRVALGEDLEWICEHADAIALLPGWEKSRGACAEKAVAEALGLKVLKLAGDQDGWLISASTFIALPGV